MRANRSLTIDQINAVHVAFFGWPCDHLTPLEEYLECDSIQQVTERIVNSSRFRAAELLRPTFDRLNLVHAALFGWPCDHLTPVTVYLASKDMHEATVKILRSDRYRWEVRGKVGLWPKDKWVMAEFKGFNIWVNLADSYISFGVLHDRWEEHEVEFMLSCLQPGDGMIDAGANIGVFTLQAAAKVGSRGRVYAFEPMNKTYDMLARSVKANGLEDRCVIHNVGLGSTRGIGSFHLSEHATNPGSSYVSMESGGDQISIVPIDVMAYDRPIRFLKMDVEGFEPHVVAGATATIRRHRPMILTEFFPRSLRLIGGSSGRQYVRQLEELGYSMTLFSEDGAGEPVTSADAHRFDDIAEPENLICTPS
ncbi:FkbM family methyltransferase [Ramlibacter tataouinensis]|uniref:Methyltransferase FkbM domain-containing protein n=1 Tax=Ramlibacter tataouinensis (strain ATCC BAA-407 / DSM 14655 / LMG 21543 / TTB310) TaxID=365046 RepID=F5XYY5_RAMTT|nr:FkbM family methyltransferase [Ramlibacter tataouinensis]AEG91973.1 Hypothetical protein Rta_08910 [Ramlibacter tataouinensis TTB310]